MCGIGYPHLSSRTSEGISSGREYELSGPEHTVLKAQLDEVFHLLNNHNYEQSSPKASRDLPLWWCQGSINPSELGYELGFLVVYPEVAAVIKRNQDRVEDARTVSEMLLSLARVLTLL